MEQNTNETTNDSQEIPQEEVQPQAEAVVQLTEAEHRKLLDDVSVYKDKYVRLLAEFENARKRMERDKVEFVKYANEGVIVDFLSILDNLELSVNAAKTKHEDYEAFLKGMELVLAHTHELLRKHGVKVIDAKGKKFDPNCHEVLMQEESDQYEDGTVIEEFQKGYMLGEKVIRTVKVKLAKQK